MPNFILIHLKLLIDHVCISDTLMDSRDKTIMEMKYLTYEEYILVE